MTLLLELNAASTSGLLKHRGCHHGDLAFGSAMCTPFANDRLRIYKACKCTATDLLMCLCFRPFRCTSGLAGTAQIHNQQLRIQTSTRLWTRFLGTDSVRVPFAGEPVNFGAT